MMNAKTSIPQLTRAERETETEAMRLNEHVEQALSAVAIRESTDTGELEAFADRIERAARDLSAALRELAGERRHEHDRA